MSVAASGTKVRAPTTSSTQGMGNGSDNGEDDVDNGSQPRIRYSGCGAHRTSAFGRFPPECAVRRYERWRTLV